MPSRLSGSFANAPAMLNNANARYPHAPSPPAAQQYHQQQQQQQHSNNNHNNHYHHQNAANGSGSGGGGGGGGGATPLLLLRNGATCALGVTSDQVLPLNKPIVPLHSVIKADTRLSRNSNNAYSGNATNTNANLAVSRQPATQQGGGPVPLTATAGVSLSSSTQLNSSTPLDISTTTTVSLPATASPSGAATAAAAAAAAVSNMQERREAELKSKLTLIIGDYLRRLANGNDDDEEESEAERQAACRSAVAALHSLSGITTTTTTTSDNSNSNSSVVDLIALTIVHMLSLGSAVASDTHRSHLSRLFIEWHRAWPTQLSADAFMAGLRVCLHKLHTLELEHHCVKSNIALLAARAVCDQLVAFVDLSAPMRHGAYYPLFFLCMQHMHKIRTPAWLRHQLDASKINLIDMLPGESPITTLDFYTIGSISM